MKKINSLKSAAALAAICIFSFLFGNCKTIPEEKTEPAAVITIEPEHKSEANRIPIPQPKEILVVQNGDITKMDVVFRDPAEGMRKILSYQNINNFQTVTKKVQGVEVIRAFTSGSRGNIPFFMFHRMNEDRDDGYAMTRKNFISFVRKLKRKHFYPLGYPMIRDASFSTVPEGYIPCCITIDDLDEGWMEYVRIIEDVFGRDKYGKIPASLSVTFFHYDRQVFADDDEARKTLDWIYQNAYLLNHSFDHRSVNKYVYEVIEEGSSEPEYYLNVEGFISEQIDAWYTEVSKFLGDRAYKVDAFVLPEGLGMWHPRFLKQIDEHPHVNKLIGVIDSMNDPWNEHIFRYAMNNDLWNIAVARALREEPYIAGSMEHSINHGYFIDLSDAQVGIDEINEHTEGLTVPLYIMP